MYRRVHCKSCSQYQLCRIPGPTLLTCQSLSNFFVDDDINLNPPISRSPEHVVQPVLLIARRGSSEIELRAQPPIENINALSGLCMQC